MEKEVDEYRVKLHLEKKYEKKIKEKDVPVEEPEETPEPPRSPPRAVEPLISPPPPAPAPQDPPKAPKAPKSSEKKPSLSKRAKEIEQRQNIENKAQKKLTMLNIIWKQQNAKPNKKVCDLGILYEEASQAGVPKNELEAILEELKEEGRVSEEHVGSLKTLVEPNDKGFFDE
jgi:hypothetical protein